MISKFFQTVKIIVKAMALAGELEAQAYSIVSKGNGRS